MKLMHTPVLVKEMLSMLPLEHFKLIIDATLGMGGHALQFLKKSSAQVVGIDIDSESLRIAELNLLDYSDRLTVVEGNFKDIKTIVNRLMLDGADFIYADLGLSSYQLNNERRGFSFNKEGPLDMRMSASGVVTASMLVNNLSRKELARIFRDYGEEPAADRIADAIIESRKHNRIMTTQQLQGIVRRAKTIKSRKHNPATLVFQALRIAVNDELNNLSSFLLNAFEVLNINGYIAVISYHSLEDRIVKEAFRQLSSDCRCKHLKCECEGIELSRLVIKKPLIPSLEEVKSNPRSRSAKLRMIQKIAQLKHAEFIRLPVVNMKRTGRETVKFFLQAVK